MMKYIDSHAHYLAKRFNRDRHKLLLDIHKNRGVEYIINSTSTLELEEGVKLAEKYDFVYLSIGDGCAYTSGPEGDKYISEDILASMIKLAKENKKIVGWGENGIDFRRPEGRTKQGKENQIYWFNRQLDASKQAELPVVIHSGNACQTVFDILKAADLPDYGYGKGMIHSYLGTPKMALEYIEMGYLISITGVVTHATPRGKNLAEVVKRIPLERVLIETDCPHLIPEPYDRKSRNHSGNLEFVVEKIAEIKNVSPEEVAEVTTANAKSFYRLKDTK